MRTGRSIPKFARGWVTVEDVRNFRVFFLEAFLAWLTSCGDASGVIKLRNTPHRGQQPQLDHLLQKVDRTALR